MSNLHFFFLIFFFDLSDNSLNPWFMPLTSNSTYIRNEKSAESKIYVFDFGRWLFICKENSRDFLPKTYLMRRRKFNLRYWKKVANKFSYRKCGRWGRSCDERYWIAIVGMEIGEWVEGITVNKYKLKYIEIKFIQMRISFQHKIDIMFKICAMFVSLVKQWATWTIMTIIYAQHCSGLQVWQTLFSIRRK